MEQSESWRELCPRFQIKNASFPVEWDPTIVWDPETDDLTFCYQAVTSSAVHALLLIVSAFHLGNSFRTADPTTNLRLKPSAKLILFTWILRIFTASSIIVLYVTSLILQFVWLKDYDAFGVISYVNLAIVLVAWMVHAFVMGNLMASTRGPSMHSMDGSDSCTLFLSWFPVLMICCLQFRSVLLGHSPNEVHRIVTMVIFSLQLLYLLASGLHLYSTCLFVGPSYEEPLFRSSADSDEARLLNEIPEAPSVTPKLGEPKTWGLVRFFLFLWVDPLMQYGAEGHLKKSDDLFELPHKLKADQHAIGLQKALARNPKSSRFYLPQILAKIWGLKWLLLGMMKLVYSFLQYCSPLFVNVLVSSIENPGSQPDYFGYIYGFGLIAVNLISNSVQLHYCFQVEQLALCIRGALVDTVYSKLLRVHSSALSDSMASGQVVNLVGTDCQKVSENCQYLHQVWAMPMQVAVALYLLYREVGFSFIGGAILTVLLVPLNQFVASKISTQVEENMKQRDARVLLMSEALNSIRVLKFHAWEKWFCDRVGVVRAKEMKTVKTIKYLDACCVYFWATTPLIMSVLTFVTYVLLGNQLTAAKVFTCLSVFGLVYLPLNAMPWIITGTVEAWISAKRIQKFLKLSEIDLELYYDVNANPNGAENAIAVQEANFSWSSNIMETTSDDSTVSTTAVTSRAAKVHLENINVEIKQGELVGIIGRVGSGKSSLLNAIIGELYKLEGSVEIPLKEFSQGFGFVPQDNWIQQGTVLSNILFSLPHRLDFYRKVTEACALSQDLEAMPAGSLTEIGEHGVTLSGGQKARIALARAVFQDKDVIIMDDPLSAVDAQVANLIFDECIVGLLKDKTRLLVTHHVDFLRSADRIIVMKDGRILENGAPSEVLHKLQSFEAIIAPTGDVNPNLENNSPEASEQTPDVNMDSKVKETEQGTPLIQDEEREFGTVKLSVYKKYWRAVGNFWGTAVFLSLFLMQASYNATDWWLSYWVTHEKITFNSTTNKTESDTGYYLAVYGGIGAVNSFFALIRSFVFAYAGLLAAYSLHDSLLTKVMRATMLFFDSTPSGRVLNRFAKDVPSVDNQLPFNVNILLACIFQLLGTLVVICYGLPWFILVLVPVVPLYYFIQRYYRCTSREVKRIATLTQSPIFSMFSETVNGLSTIRAMRAETFFYGRYRQLLDDNLRSQFADIVCNKWLTMRLQLLGMVIISGVVIIALLVKSAAGVLGLTVSYSLTIVGILNGFVISLIETEKEMVSVERLMQYLEDVEEEKYGGLYQAPNQWPQLGATEFKNVSLRYRGDLPLALRNIVLTIKPAERIGVVGRTGAGKSSFLATLFRMAEIEEGAISIDGVDIAHLPLHQLRSKLAIIPQTPSLFNDTLRNNIDPLHKHSDAELWTAIDMCDLRNAVVKLGGHLDVMVGENGRKLSLGQRQLVCLVRALLTKAKVLCLDEATASVDFETDRLIQKTLRQAFANSTIITIAHRLQTVMDYDRIVVMSDGKIVECDSPQNLLQRPSSHFFMLYQQSQRSTIEKHE